MNKDNFLLLILSFSITIAFVYFTTPQPDVIYKFPTPETEDKLIYQKHNGDCYKYKSKPVPCPSNPQVISSQDA